MNIGKLRHRVTLKKPVKTDDGQGGYRMNWDSLDKNIWAEMLVPSFRQQVANGGVQSVEQVQARIRKGSGVAIGDRIRWDDGALYDVIAVDASKTGEDILGLKALRRRGA